MQTGAVDNIDDKISGWPERTALAGLFAFCLFPFLVPFRTQPIPSFYAEWLALLLGVLSLPLLEMRPSPLQIPRIACLPLGLAGLIGVQVLLSPTGLHMSALIAVLYLLWLFLLMLLVARLRQHIGLASIARCVALALVLAAVLNACNSLLFQAGVRANYSWFFMRPDRGGNLGQVNMLADLLWVGLVSLLYGWRNSQRPWLWSLGLPFMLVASALTGARAPLLYALWLPCAALLLRDPRLLRACLFISACYFMLVGLIHVFPPGEVTGTDTVSRLTAGVQMVGGSSIRLDLMRMATMMMAVSPWSGIGWGGFAWESYQMAGPVFGWQSVGEHAHQLFFHLGAELGLVAPLFVLVMLVLWVLPMWRQRAALAGSTEHWWAVTAAGVILLHAQLEYPLWYAHLLGVCGILLVCAEQRMWSLDGFRPSTLLIGALMACGVYVLGASVRDYVRLEQWLYQDMRRTGLSVPEGHYRALAALHPGSLLQPQIVRMLAAVMPPTRDHLDEKRALCMRALQSEPQSPTVFTCALLDGLAGEGELAQLRMRQAVLVFGDYLPDYLRRLDETLSPAELSAHSSLLGYAKQVQAESVGQQ